MQFANINGLTLHYQEIGGPEGAPTIVFINSLGSDFRIWRDVIVRLVGQFRIFTYDKRGHGLSDTGDTPYEIETHAEDLAGLLDHAGIPSAIVVGLSVGGQIALALSAMRPDLVKGLVLSDTGHRIGTPEGWEERISMVEMGGIEDVAEASMKLWFTEEFHKSHPDDIAGYRNMISRQDLEGYAATCEALRDSDQTEAAEAVSVPALCIVGDEDQSTPPSLVKELAGLIPDADFIEITGAAHIPQIEKPDEFTGLLTAFVKTLPKRTG